MPLPTKFFKVTLPLATATTASIITAYLIISSGVDKDKIKEEDQALENIELKSKEFEEELIQGPEEYEKGEKSDSDHSKEEEKKKDLEAESPEKDKEESLSDQDPTKVLAEVQNAVTQLANQQGETGVKEKQLKIERQGQISQSQGAETTSKNNVNPENPLSSQEESESSLRQSTSPEIKTGQEDSVSKEQSPIEKETQAPPKLDEERKLEVGKDPQTALKEEEIRDQTVSEDMSSPADEKNLDSQASEDNLNEASASASEGHTSEQEDLREAESETDSMQNGDHGEEEDLGKQQMSGSEGDGDSDSRDRGAIVTDEQLDILQNLGLQIKDKLSLLGRLVR